ncbi:transporter substrate-binding domain-containing protein [Owenweeksia hongkongensis]|uniref:transporter substrate-binding domain-containing protein n=1 Tax=Owenweeksia hongkongensis TaxID=253245 RepID=UPI003A8D82A4
MPKFLSTLFLFLFSGILLLAQDSTLVIGVREAPPFVLNEANGVNGLSVDFWHLVEDEAGVDFVFKNYDNLPDLLAAVKSGEVDMSINPITVTDERMHDLYFSQPFFISGTVVARKFESTWWSVLKNIFSWQFFSAVAVLLFVIFLFGLAIWFFERRKNPEQFGKGVKGIGDGFWWSAVTMTTVGYGDKSPVSRGGRVVGFIWMFAAIIMISSLTAGIASALTVQSLGTVINSVEDLRKFNVASIDGSSSSAHLKKFGVETVDYKSVKDALLAVDNDEIDMVVYDRPILKHYINELNLEDIKIAKKNLRTDYYSFSFKRGSELRDFLDPYVVQVLNSDEWGYKLKLHMGDD